MTGIALFPGVFDPPTLGHLDIIKRAPLICEKLVVAVAENLAKTTLFTLEERLVMLQTVTHNYPYVEIAAFSGLAVEFAKKRGASVLLRGLRSCNDFEYELQMAKANHQIGGIETVFLMAHHSHISSSLIREIAHFGGALKDFVPREIVPFLDQKFTPHK